MNGRTSGAMIAPIQLHGKAGVSFSVDTWYFVTGVDEHEPEQAGCRVNSDDPYPDFGLVWMAHSEDWFIIK